MAKKKTPTRKTTKKSGAKKKVAKKTTRKTKSQATKSSAAKKRKKAPPTRASSLPRAKKVGKKKKATKKKVAKKTKKKVTAASRRAERKVRPQRRKPETGGRAAKHEILEFFGSEDVSKLTPEELKERKLSFLRAYANRGIVRDGCVAASTSWGTYQRWREKDEGFNMGCKHAEMLAADRLEAEAHRRAHDGYEKPVIYQGEITETYTEYSDSLMSVLMKGYKKDKYKDRSEHSTPVGKPMQLEAETKDSVVSSILGMITNKPDPDT